MAHLGLVWEKNVLDPAHVSPKWGKEPDLNAIRATAAKELQVDDPENLKVSFLAEGIFNKVYRVCVPNSDEEYVMRVSLPVQPFYKTYTKVTTLEYLREHTNLPLPRVFAYDTSTDNLIGFEWIMMTLIPGVPLAKIYLGLSMEQKHNIVKQMVGYVVQLFQQQFTSIGALRKTTDGGYDIGRMVTIPFWWYRRAQDLANKGPFETLEDCLVAQLQLMTTEAQQCYEEDTGSSDSDVSTDESDFAIELQNLKVLTLALPSILEGISPPTTDAQGHILTAITHNDIAVQNILIDPDTFEVTGIVDWEDVSAQPLANFCQFPHFLRFGGVNCEIPSQLDDGAFHIVKGDECTVDVVIEHPIPGVLDEFMLRNRFGELRDLFLEEMQRVCPAWVEEHYKGAELRDLVQVINSADVSTNQPYIRTWLSCWADGQKKTMQSIMQASRDGKACFDQNTTRSNQRHRHQDDHSDCDAAQIWTPAMLPLLPCACNNTREPQLVREMFIPDNAMNQIKGISNDYLHIHEAGLGLAQSVCVVPEAFSEYDSEPPLLMSCSLTETTADPIQPLPSVQGMAPAVAWSLVSQFFAALWRALIG